VVHRAAGINKYGEAAQASLYLFGCSAQLSEHCIRWRSDRSLARGLRPKAAKDDRRQEDAHMKTIIRGVALASAVSIASMAFVMPGAASADDAPSPCKALKRIVAAAPGGFASIQPGDGQAVAQPYGADAHCAASHGSYECTWTKGPDPGSASDALEAVAADIAACLPDATHDQNTPARQHFTIGPREQRIQITATAAGAARLKLAVSGK
jgi:hypothetical protein